MWEIPLSTLILVAGLLYAQHKFYDFQLEMKIKQEFSLSEQKLREFEELKKQVDSLNLKAGFKR